MEGGGGGGGGAGGTGEATGGATVGGTRGTRPTEAGWHGAECHVRDSVWSLLKCPEGFTGGAAGRRG